MWIDRLVSGVSMVAASTAVMLVTPALLAQAAGGPAGLTEATQSPEGALARARQHAVEHRLVMAEAELQQLLRGPLAERLDATSRATAIGLLKSVKASISAANPRTIGLQRAELCLQQGDLQLAGVHATRVKQEATASPADRETAERLLSQVESRRAEFAPQVPGLIEQARADFNAQRYGASKSAISAIFRSGVPLSDEQMQELEGYKLRLVDLERAGHADLLAGSAGGGRVALGMLQPGQVRRNNEPGGDPQSEPGQSEPPSEEPPPASQPASQPGDLPSDQPPPIDLPMDMQDQPPPPPPQPAYEPVYTPPPAPVESSQQDIIQAAMRADALRMLAEADRAYALSRYNEAADRYAVVLSQFRAYLGADEVARAERQLADARVRLQDNSIRQDLQPEVVQSLDLQRQKARAMFDNEMGQAEAALTAGDIGKAQELAARARLTAGGAREVFNESEFAAFMQRVDELSARIETRRSELARDAAIRQQNSLAEEARDAEVRRLTERERRIDENIIRVRALQQERKYEEALQVVEETLFLDPNNPTALLLRDILLDITVYRRYNIIQSQKQIGQAKLTLDNEEEMIPVSTLMDFPTDWPAKTFQRGEALAFADTPENRRVYADLGSRRTDVVFAENRLEDALTFVQKLTNVNMDVDWQNLETIGINKDTLVTLKLTNKPITTVLDKLVEKASPDNFTKAGWTVQDGVLTVSSDEALRKQRTLVIYNIQDLLFDIPDYVDVPELDLTSVLQQSGGGQGQSPFQDDNAEQPERPTREERIRQIQDIIYDTVDAGDSNGWVDRGGSTGTMRELNGSLIIQNTARNHREIVGLLSKLREIRNMQINVETKFLLVNQNWFEQIGFDLDIVINANNNQVRTARGVDNSVQSGDFFDFLGTTSRSGTPPRRGLQRTLLGRAAFDLDGNGTTTGPGEAATRGQPVVNPRGWSPVGAFQNSLGLAGALAQGDFANQVLDVAPALGIAGQFLDDIQVDFLIQATQADQRTVQLTAPRLTFTNGQTANIYVVTQVAFVSDLQPIVGDSAVGFDPEVDPLSEGVTMLIEGVVSADRRYVTMNIDAGVARIDGFAQQGVTAVAGGQLVNSADTQSFIQLPTITVTRVRTTATVPDEGTILLGGQRLVTELEVETGVPVLSKIPIINRFFTNRIETKEEQTLLILLKPTILIQTEEEERAHPGLLDSVRTGLGAP